MNKEESQTCDELLQEAKEALKENFSMLKEIDESIDRVSTHLDELTDWVRNFKKSC